MRHMMSQFVEEALGACREQWSLSPNYYDDVKRW
jgi:hypothetical protein